jgi:predicted tellurium resistance membrane protein TerC
VLSWGENLRQYFAFGRSKSTVVREAHVAELITFDNGVALLTLSVLEIVLGIDNIVFLAILTGKLPERQQPGARRLGLGLALIMRILLLLAIGWVMGLTAPLFSVPAFWTGNVSDLHSVNGRDLIMLVGGLFLIGKATFEIHDKLEGGAHETKAKSSNYGMVIFQIVLIDMVFSLDSVITAIGMVQSNSGSHGGDAHGQAAAGAAEAATRPQWVGLTIMITAVIIAIAVMLAFAGPISKFVEKHPTVKMLALAFLILIGVVLFAEGLHVHIPKGYIYFAMAFSILVEFLNMRLRKISEPVHLKQSYVKE